MSNILRPNQKAAKPDSENLALACHGCNLFKSNKTESFDETINKTVKLFNPRVDIWREHFVWTGDYTEIVGLTAVGRATVKALNMNRENLINQRKMLHRYGKHPPEDFS